MEINTSLIYPLTYLPELDPLFYLFNPSILHYLIHDVTSFNIREAYLNSKSLPVPFCQCYFGRRLVLGGLACGAYSATFTGSVGGPLGLLVEQILLLLEQFNVIVELLRVHGRLLSGPSLWT